MSKMETLANMFDVKIGEEFWLIDEKGNKAYSRAYFFDEFED